MLAGISKKNFNKGAETLILGKKLCRRETS
jgi:hypothetical protein